MLIVDELSAGPRPLVVHRAAHALRAAADTHGMGVLWWEQHAARHYAVADRVWSYTWSSVAAETLVLDLVDELGASDVSICAHSRRRAGGGSGRATRRDAWLRPLP